MRLWAMRTSWLAASIALSGCAGVTLDRESQTIATELRTARRAGAARCTPRELARAEAHLEFVAIELEQGHLSRAEQHARIAKAALVEVGKRATECLPKDRDEDGIVDESDACPDVPGPRALAGCPDRDDDGVVDTDDACPDAQGPKALGGCPDRDGDGIADRSDKCPEVPEDRDGNHDDDGCPEDEDRDRDGVVDGKDRCIDAPEDVDRFEDEDGCPDLDDDVDGIPDAEDRCPLAPETKNGFEDEDGCPDAKLALVEVRRDLGKIEIKQKVHFATGKAIIKGDSFDLLDQVATVLVTNPTMHVLVEGHTDSVGSDVTNLRLSEDRALAVRDYLVRRGVEGERLTAIGFGKEKPIDSNQTKLGRERNRRVEFTITKE